MQDGEPRHFRYTVTCKNTSTVLTPKKLDADLDRTNLRGTMFGAAFDGCYDKVPKTDMARILWEDGRVGFLFLFEIRGVTILHRGCIMFAHRR